MKEVRAWIKNRREVGVFFLIFLLTLASQLYLWFPDGLTDEALWTQSVEDTVRESPVRVQRFYATSTREVDPAFIYPGTTIILPASALMLAGVKSETALRLAVSFFVAFFSAIAIALYRGVRGRGLSWVAPAALLVCCQYYSGTTIGSVAVMPILAALMLAMLALFERARKGAVPDSYLAAVGILGGLATATRLDVSALVMSTAFVFLCVVLRFRALAIAAIALITFYLLNPFFWLEPIGYVVSMYESFKVQELYHVAYQTPLTWLHTFFYLAPLTLLSLALWLLMLLLRPRKLPVPLPFILWLFLATALMWFVFYLSPFHQTWYLYPFFVLWDVLLPLLLFALFDEMPFAGSSDPAMMRKMLGFLAACLLSLVYVFPFAIQLHAGLVDKHIVPKSMDTGADPIS